MLLRDHFNPRTLVVTTCLVLWGVSISAHGFAQLPAPSGAALPPEAVRRLTSQSAAVFGMPERGLLREGFAADLLLFDPATVGRGPSRRVFDLPGGAPRLHTDALGVHGVWVNGRQVANADGLIDGAPLAGTLMTEFAA